MISWAGDKMFNNYLPGTHSSSSFCVHNSNNEVVMDTSDFTIEDKYGNLKALQWSPNSRFSINITTDYRVPISPNSKVLNVSGMTPHNIVGSEGMYSYNTADSRCWKYTSGHWVEESEIVEFPNSTVIGLFTSRDSSIRINIKNFRGESVFLNEAQGNIITFTVDDALSQILLQGYYNLDVYRITPTSIQLVRRVPISIGYNMGGTQSHPQYPSYDSGKMNLATDNTLTLNNGVLSVNVSQSCSYGDSLPISSDAVFRYSQPKNLIISLDSSLKLASVSAPDIHNFVVLGGNALCLYNNMYMECIRSSSDRVEFSKLLIHEGTVKSYSVIIDSAGKYTEEINEVRDNDPSDDIDSINDKVDRIHETISSMCELYNSHNDKIIAIERKIEEISEDMSSKADSSVIESIVEEQVTTHISDKNISKIVEDIISTTATYDGGVIE